MHIVVIAVPICGSVTELDIALCYVAGSQNSLKNYALRHVVVLGWLLFQPVVRSQQGLLDMALCNTAGSQISRKIWQLL